MRALGPGSSLPDELAEGYVDLRATASAAEAEACRLAGPGVFRLGRYIAPSTGMPGPSLGLSPTHFTTPAAILGPAESGKTTGMVLPWIRAAIQNRWSVLTLDVKGTMRDDIGDAALAMCRTYVIDAFDEPNATHSWNWVSDLTDDIAVEGATASVLGRRPTGDNAVFHARDTRILRTILRLRVADSPFLTEPSHVSRLLADHDYLRAAVDASRIDEVAGIADLLDADAERRFKLTEMLLSELDTVCGPVANRPSFSFSKTDADGAPSVVIVRSTLGGGARSERFSSLAISQFVAKSQRRHGSTPAPALLMIDEAARVEDRVDLQVISETLRSAGVRPVFVFQSVPESASNPTRRATLANADPMIALAGLDFATADYVSEQTGSWNAPVVDKTSAPAVLRASTRSSTVRHEERRVVTASAVQRPPFAGRPALIQLRRAGAPFFTDLTFGRQSPTRY
ncbi:MAG: type IV secretory system conjugative DNA transfer family protein [bacterium]|nr:type IV secretory system conjugative DNA transfer family protein [bacterium]